MPTESTNHPQPEHKPRRAPDLVAKGTQPQPQTDPAVGLLQRALLKPARVTAQDVLRLQRLVGNRATGQLLSRPTGTPHIQRLVASGLRPGTQVRIIKTGQIGTISRELFFRGSYEVNIFFANHMRDVEFRYDELDPIQEDQSDMGGKEMALEFSDESQQKESGMGMGLNPMGMNFGMGNMMGMNLGMSNPMGMNLGMSNPMGMNFGMSNPMGMSLGMGMNTTVSNQMPFSFEPPKKKEEQHQVVFGHGWYNPKKKIVLQKRLVLYGPPGSTLTRGVSKWLRDKGPIQPGSGLLREISNGKFDQVRSQFDGECPSFDQALWDAASESEYPKVLEPGTEIGRLGLEPQKEENVQLMPNVFQIQKGFKGLEDIEQSMEEGTTIHWGACLQIEGVLRDRDVTVLLHPDLSRQVYPPSGLELLNEQRHQEKLERAKNKTVENKPISQVFVSSSQNPVEGIDGELKNILDTQFASTDKLDDQVEKIDKLVIQYGVVRGKMLRYLAQNGKKGT